MTVEQPLLADRRVPAVARRPAFPVAIFFVLGIALFHVAPDQPTLWLSIAAIAAFTAFSLLRFTRCCSACIAVATVASGITLAQLAFFHHAVDDIGNFASDQPALAEVRLSLDHAPQLVYPQSPTGRPMPPKQMIVARALAVRGHDGWIATEGTLLVQVSHPNPWLRIGQRIEADGLLGHLITASNPGQLDWATVYRQRGILASLQVSRADNVMVIGDDGIGPLDWLRQEARHLLSVGFTVRRMADYALLRALVLGDSDPDSRDVQEAFAQVGLAYQLSISGLHIVVLTALAYLVCRLFQMSPRWAITVCVGIVVLYGMIALPSTSARRAVFICIAFLAAPLWSRTGDKLQLLSLAAIGLLIVDPLEVNTAGFQLGFVTVLGLTLFAPRLLPSTGELFATRVESRWIRWRRQAAIALRAWLIVSAIAWVVSLPLVTFYFGQISPWAVGAGVLVFPIVMIALVGGWAKMLGTLLWPSIATLAARAAEVPSFAMRLLAVRLTHLPDASIDITPPAVWMIVAFYVLLLATLIPFKRLWQFRAACGSAFVGGVIFLLLICRASSAASPTDELTVTLLDIGAGQCGIIEVPHEAGVTLIDCGSDSVTDVARSVLVPYLQSVHQRSITRVFLSHSDYDHISALSSLTPMLNGPVYTSSYFAHFAERDPPAAALLKKLDASHRSPTILRQDNHIALGADASIDVLWPPDGTPYNVNETGLVLRLNYHNRSVLFPADIQATAMRALLTNPAALHADVLVAAHHGSSEVTTDAFLHAVDPQYIVASNSAPLTGKQRIFDQLVGRATPLFRTNRCGAITIHLHADSTVTITTFKPVASSY